MVKIPGCDDTDTAFSIQADENIMVRGLVLKVGVEPDKVRKALLTAYFNALRSIENALPDHSSHFKAELATFTVYYMRTDTPIFKLDRATLIPVFDNDTLWAMGTTAAEIQTS